MRTWVNNEDGPLCSCGSGMVVKTTDSGRAGALCFAHSREAGAWIELPEEVPADWMPWTDEKSSAAELVGQPRKETIAGEVGAFIPRVYAEHFAGLIRAVRKKLPAYHEPTLAALWQSLRTAEAED
jgi:hypothetical protein